MRIVLTFGLALLLAACGRPSPEVYSQRPLLVKAAGKTGPRLRPGLWRWDDGGCDFDDTKPIGTWPDCVIAVIVRDDEILTGAMIDAVLRERYVLADGLPMILQVQVLPAAAPAERHYYGVRPTLADGQVVEMIRWPVTCQPASKDHSGSYIAPEPGSSAIKGLTVNDGGRCLTTSRDLLRAAVIASEGWTADRDRLRWVRSAEQ
jgi:hypothetical protein